MPIIFLLLFAIALVNSISPGHAEVLLTPNALTVNTQDTTMKEILEDMRNHDVFEIIAFEDTTIGNVRISKTFWNLPLEKGLAHLFNGWNYGITRDVSTGKITVLYLVSLRTEPSISPITQHAISPKTTNQYTRSSQSSSLLLTGNDEGRETSGIDDEEELEETTAQLREPGDEEF